ncbi:hypothetical protein IJT93_01520 [bacterium]|nr:hypothetical protein [bacterium]
MQFSRDIKWPRQNSDKIKKYSDRVVISILTICAPIGYLSGLARDAARLGPERLNLDQSSLTERFSDIWVKGFWYWLMYAPVFLIGLAPLFLLFMGVNPDDNISIQLLYKFINLIISVIGFIWMPLVYLREITKQETDSRYDYAAVWDLFRKNIKTVLMLALINVGYNAILALAVFIAFAILCLLGLAIAVCTKISGVICLCVGLFTVIVSLIMLYYGLILSGYLQIAFACAVGFHVYENGLGDSFVRTDAGFDYDSGSKINGAVPAASNYSGNLYGGETGALNGGVNASPVNSFTPVGIGIAGNSEENSEISIGDGTDRY